MPRTNGQTNGTKEGPSVSTSLTSILIGLSHSGLLDPLSGAFGDFDYFAGLPDTRPLLVASEQRDMRESDVFSSKLTPSAGPGSDSISRIRD